MATAWIDAHQAAEALGCHVRTISRYVQKGQIERRKSEDTGLWQYSLSDVEQLQRRLNDGKERPELDPESALLGQAMTFIETLLPQAKHFSDQLMQLNRTLLDRCAALEATNAENFAARERLLSEAAEREMLWDGHKRKEERKDKALGKLMQVVPAAMRAKAAKDPATKLLTSLTEDQLVLLLETDLVTDEQKDLIRAVRGSSPIDTDGTQQKEDPPCQDDQPASAHTGNGVSQES